MTPQHLKPAVVYIQPPKSRYYFLKHFKLLEADESSASLITKTCFKINFLDVIC